jgi:hypothetical protein
MSGEKTFVRITNREIFDEIRKVHDQVLKINGKVKNHTWLVRGSYAFTLFVLALLIKYVVV